MAELLFRQRQCRLRLAEIEGDPIEDEPIPPDPTVIRDTRALFDDPREAFDDIKLGLLGELERSLDDIERRMARALKFRAARVADKAFACSAGTSGDERIHLKPIGATLTALYGLVRSRGQWG